MKQIKIPLQVTIRSEVSLDKYLSDISKLPLISVEEEALLASRVRDGDRKALERIVSANLRFVVSVSKQYQNLGLGLPDLINEGNLGLIKAAYRFDETRGFRFISYAVWWIRQSILQAISEQARLIRLPAHQVTVLNRLHKMTQAFEQENEREPTLSELSLAMDQQPEEISNLISVANQALSLDMPVNQEESTCVKDLLSDTENQNPDRHLEYESLCDDVERAVNSLPKREAMVIKLFFGLNGYQQLGVNDIADRMDISSTLVRRLKDKALKRLRIARSYSLRNYLD